MATMVKVERPPVNGFGFSLARIMYLDCDGAFCPENQDEAGALPGECFYYKNLRGCIVLSCTIIAYWNVKRLQIEQHRAWMALAWVVAGFIITVRLIGIVTQVVFEALAPEVHYEANLRSVIDCMFNGNQIMVESIHRDREAFYNGNDPDRHVLINVFGSNGSGEVDQVSAQLRLSLNGAAWLALSIHVIAVAPYLHLTPTEATRLRRVSYEHQVEAGMRRHGNAGLTAERLGDTELFIPHAP